MPYVYSTATSDIKYCAYHPGPETQASAKLKKTVLVRGGANLAPLTGRLITPRGVVTQVSDEDLEFLLQNEAFIRHQKAGHMHVDKAAKEPDKVAAAGMNPQDLSAPITPKSKEVLGTAVPVVPPPPAHRKA